MFLYLGYPDFLVDFGSQKSLPDNLFSVDRFRAYGRISEPSGSGSPSYRLAKGSADTRWHPHARSLYCFPLTECAWATNCLSIESITASCDSKGVVRGPVGRGHVAVGVVARAVDHRPGTVGHARHRIRVVRGIGVDALDFAIAANSLASHKLLSACNP